MIACFLVADNLSPVTRVASVTLSLPPLIITFIVYLASSSGLFTPSRTVQLVDVWPGLIPVCVGYQPNIGPLKKQISLPAISLPWLSNSLVDATELLK